MAGFAILANSSLPLNLDRARADLEERLSELAGRPVTVHGEASFRLLPRPVIQLSNLSLGRPGEAEALHIAHAFAQLDLIDGLFGRTDIARLTLVRPEFPAQAQDAAPPSTPSPQPQPRDTPMADEGPAHVAGRAMQGALRRFQGVRRVEIRDGLYRPSPGAAAISSINVDFAWDRQADPATLEGSFVWNGQPTRIDASLSRPTEFLAGRDSSIRIEVEAAPMSLAFDGTGAAGTPPVLEGRLEVETPSVARLNRWLGESAIQLPDFGAVRLETDVRLADDRAFLNRSALRLGDMRGQGALELALTDGAPPMLSGTLAFEQFDFDQFGTVIAPVPRNLLDLQRRIPLGFVRGFDLDLRLSAGQTRLAGVPMSDLAATMKFSGGLAILDIGDTTLLGGRGQARFTVDTNAATPQLTGTYALQAVNAGQLADRFSAPDARLTGTATITGQLDMPVGSWGQIARGNRITAKVDIASGTLAGLPTPAQLEAQGQGSFELSAEQEAMAFTRLRANLSSYSTFLRIEDMVLDTDQGSIDVSGLVSLGESVVSLDGVFKPANAEASLDDDGVFTSSKPLEFNLKGEWPELGVTVTPRAKPM